MAGGALRDHLGGIGLLVTCWCSCTICCHLGCAYCLVLCGGGIANLTGSSVPLCCNSNKCNNIVFGPTGLISFVIRGIAIIIFSVSLANWQGMIDRSEECKSDCPSIARYNFDTDDTGCSVSFCTSPDGNGSSIAAQGLERALHVFRRL